MPATGPIRIRPSLVAILIFGWLLNTPLIPCLSAGAAATEKEEARVDFERHVMGLFGRLGCNSGSCHGSFQGRGGFRLSLFGYDPEKDYLAITRDSLGRRLNRVDPENSLMLLKPTGQVEHGGGVRFAKGSWQFQMLRDWIVSGTPWQKGSGEIAKLAISPPEYRFSRPGESGHLQITARFADGSQQDITRFCDFRSNDDAVAEVDAQGHLKTRKPGDTVVVVAYRGNIRAVRVLVPRETAADFHYPEIPEVNYIDHEVFAKLRGLKIIPSELADDAEFLRRVTIDTIGSLPSPDETRAFLADEDPDKRAEKIETLLLNPLHAALWATKFCDITGNNTDALEQPRPMQNKRSQMWHDWFRKRLGENMPYDRIVEGVLCATSRDGQTPEEWLKQVKELDAAAEKGFSSIYASKPTLDLFWRRQGKVPMEQWGEKTAAAFLGVRLECAQCHKHPFDRWTQADYRAYANVFGQVAVGSSPEATPLITAENAERTKASAAKKNQVIAVREVFISPKAQALAHPDGGKKPLPPRALGGPVIKVAKGEDMRTALYEWLRSPKNPFFARSFVNRVWGHYLGMGLVDPVDNFSLANPPSNEMLLDALAKDFVTHDYDIRHLERTILSSRVYQLVSATNETNRQDRTNYSHASLKRLMAEVFLDVLNTALETTEDWGPDAPAGSRAVEVGSSRVQNGNLAYCLRIFGRPPRSTACDCERALEPALPQTLFLMNDTTVVNKLQKNRRVAKLLKSKMSDADILDELFLATLTRLPNETEKHAVEGYVASKKDRRVVFTDVLWALINTREFVLNH